MQTIKHSVTEILLTELSHCRQAFILDLLYHIHLMHFSNLQASYDATVRGQWLHLFCTAHRFYTCRHVTLF